MTEAVLKGKLVSLARLRLPQSYVVIRHEDRFTHGIPDISITGNKITSWLEVKHANPGFKCKGIQELTMLRLALAGHARFVIYWEHGSAKHTYIVHPKHIGDKMDSWPQTDGFDHEWVLVYVMGVHNDHNGP